MVHPSLLSLFRTPDVPQHLKWWGLFLLRPSEWQGVGFCTNCVEDLGQIFLMAAERLSGSVGVHSSSLRRIVLVPSRLVRTMWPLPMSLRSVPWPISSTLYTSSTSTKCEPSALCQRYSFSVGGGCNVDRICTYAEETRNGWGLKIDPGLRGPPQRFAGCWFP